MGREEAKTESGTYGKSSDEAGSGEEGGEDVRGLHFG